MTTLTLKTEPTAPLEAETIVPDRFAGKSIADIARMTVAYGNGTARLGDFFEIEADGSADITVQGDCSRVKNIGAGMTQGTVIVRGDAGMHIGAAMRGGAIHVHGNAGDWAGAEMKGGLIHIRGNAGHDLGGAYRGSRYGMNRGLILVEGNTGNETGALMRRGLIAVMGNTGDFTGAFMVAGSILVFGTMGIRAGAGLLRGTIVALHRPELLPTFRYDCCYRPGFLKLIFQDLRRRGLQIEDARTEGLYRRYSGDLNRLGKGEILVYDQR